MKQKINIIGLLLGAISIAFTMYITLYKTDIFLSKKYFPIILTAMLSSVLAVFVLLAFRTLRTNNKSLTIALLGFPQTGKTVYLTVLFNELQKIRTGLINFAPYGNETIEKVSRDLTYLQCGNWLPKTEIDQFFYYRATTTIGELIKRNYKLEIGDFAGERFDDLSNSSFNWLHRDKYFDYAVQSNAILISISSEIFISHDYKIEVINSTIAAINILAQKKGYSDSHKMKEPICLIILKCDILDWKDKDDAYYLDMINDLLIVCKKRSLSFKSFFVSSVGETNDGKPSRNLEPFNVADSLLWLLRNDRN